MYLCVAYAEARKPAGHAVHRDVREDVRECGGRVREPVPEPHRIFVSNLVNTRTVEIQ